jgi:hypothetical protein
LIFLFKKTAIIKYSNLLIEKIKTIKKEVNLFHYFSLLRFFALQTLDGGFFTSLLPTERDAVM